MAAEEETVSDRDIEKDYRAIITTAKEIQRERKAAERKRAEYACVLAIIAAVSSLLLAAVLPVAYLRVVLLPLVEVRLQAAGQRAAFLRVAVPLAGPVRRRPDRSVTRVV